MSKSELLAQIIAIIFDELKVSPEDGIKALEIILNTGRKAKEKRDNEINTLKRMMQ